MSGFDYRAGRLRIDRLGKGGYDTDCWEVLRGGEALGRIVDERVSRPEWSRFMFYHARSNFAVGADTLTNLRAGIEHRYGGRP